MVTLITPNPLQIDLLQYQMDLAGIAYKVVPAQDEETWLIVDGVPLDYDHALKWVAERM